MSYKASYYRGANVNGMTLEENVTQNYGNIKGANEDLAAAIAGTLTTRTDNDTGVITVAAGHGITAADTVIVTWTAAGVRYNRYNVDVTAVTSTTISIDIGAGTNLPSSSTAVTVAKQITEDCNLGAITMANVPAFVFKGTGDYILVLEVDNSGTEYHAYTVTSAAGLAFVNGATAPDGTALTFDDILTGLASAAIIRKLHFGNIATASNTIGATILHD